MNLPPCSVRPSRSNLKDNNFFPKGIGRGDVLVLISVLILIKALNKLQEKNRRAEKKFTEKKKSREKSLSGNPGCLTCTHEIQIKHLLY